MPAVSNLGAGPSVPMILALCHRLVPCAKMDFDTIMAAIGSNNGRLGYTDGRPRTRPLQLLCGRAAPSLTAAPCRGSRSRV